VTIRISRAALAGALAISGIALATPQASAASELWMVAESPDTYMVVDAAHIEPSETSTKAWIYWVTREPEQVGGLTVASAKAFYDYDCRANRSKLLIIAPFDDAGTSLAVEDLADASAWQPVVAGSMEANVERFVCGAPGERAGSGVRAPSDDWLALAQALKTAMRDQGADPAPGTP
jgi:hypothetical protein